jgi:uncharacterized protein YraI
LPQFNWAIMGPIVLLVALIAGGGYFLITHSPHSSGRIARTVAAPVEAASARSIATPTGVQLPGRVIGTPHIRSNPSSNATVLQDLQSGQTITVSACSGGCAWYLVANPGQPAAGWVSSAFVDIQGDENRLPSTR